MTQTAMVQTSVPKYAGSPPVLTSVVFVSKDDATNSVTWQCLDQFGVGLQVTGLDYQYQTIAFDLPRTGTSGPSTPTGLLTIADSVPHVQRVNTGTVVSAWQGVGTQFAMTSLFRFATHAWAREPDGYLDFDDNGNWASLTWTYSSTGTYSFISGPALATNADVILSYPGPLVPYPPPLGAGTWSAGVPNLVLTRVSKPTTDYVSACVHSFATTPPNGEGGPYLSTYHGTVALGTPLWLPNPPPNLFIKFTTDQSWPHIPETYQYTIETDLQWGLTGLTWTPSP
jgi:hypothetical protein